MKTEHTPDSRRPYRVVKDQDEGGSWQIWTAQDNAPGSRNNYVICEHFQHEHEAIEFVRACNSHEALVEALKAVERELQCPARNTTMSYRRDGSVIVSQTVRDMVSKILAEVTQS